MLWETFLSEFNSVFIDGVDLYFGISSLFCYWRVIVCGLIFLVVLICIIFRFGYKRFRDYFFIFIEVFEDIF